MDKSNDNEPHVLARAWALIHAHDSLLLLRPAWLKKRDLLGLLHPPTNLVFCFATDKRAGSMPLCPLVKEKKTISNLTDPYCIVDCSAGQK